MLCRWKKLWAFKIFIFPSVLPYLACFCKQWKHGVTLAKTPPTRNLGTCQPDSPRYKSVRPHSFNKAQVPVGPRLLCFPIPFWKPVVMGSITPRTAECTKVCPADAVALEGSLPSEKAAYNEDCWAVQSHSKPLLTVHKVCKVTARGCVQLGGSLSLGHVVCKQGSCQHRSPLPNTCLFESEIICSFSNCDL